MYRHRILLGHIHTFVYYYCRGLFKNMVKFLSVYFLGTKHLSINYNTNTPSIPTSVRHTCSILKGLNRLNITKVKKYIFSPNSKKFKATNRTAIAITV